MKKSRKDRLKCAINESTRAPLRGLPSPKGKAKRRGASLPQKEANSALLRSATPSEGRGSRGRSLLPMEGGAPKGRRLDGDGGMKKSGKDRLKRVAYESTLSTAARSPFPMGKAAIREYSFSRIVKANTGYVEKKNNDGQSLPLEGKVASGASRIGY